MFCFFNISACSGISRAFVLLYVQASPPWPHIPAGWGLGDRQTVVSWATCAVSLQWAEALSVFQRAADWIGLESRKSLWGQFWSAHQRFFKYLCVAAKVRRLVELAREELAQDKVS